MLKKITLYVTCLHVLGVLFLLFLPLKKPHLPPQKFVVQTHTFKQPSSLKSSKNFQRTSSAATPAPKPPKKKPVPQKKQPKQKPPKQKPIPQQKTPQEKKPENRKPELDPAPSGKPIPAQKSLSLKEKQPHFQDDFAKELEEIIEKINKTTPPSSLQEIINPVQETVNSFATTVEESYQNALLTYLYEALHLPERGEVTLQLTLKEEGSLAKIVVLKAESVKNKTYLEKQLPLLRFPSLRDLQVKEKTFVVTFCNED